MTAAWPGWPGWLGWLGCALGLALVPLPSSAAVRARALAGTAPRPPGRQRPGAASTRRLRRAGALVAAGGLLVLGRAAGPALAVGAAAVSMTVLVLVRQAAAARRERDAEWRLLTALRVLIADLRAGAGVSAALAGAAAAAGPYEPDFVRAAAAAGDGRVAEALAQAHSPRLAVLAHAWRVADRVGAPLADTLDGVAHDLVARADTGRAVAGAVAGARASAALLAGLPLLGLLLGAAMGARPSAFLTGPGAGRLVCCLGLVLDAAGFAWTQWLVRAAERT